MKRFIGSFVALLIVFVYALMVIIAQPHVVQAAPIVEPVPPPTEGFKGFGEQVQYPASLDELYALIEGRAHGWVFTECSELPTPFFGWQQVKLLERLSVDDEGQGLFIISKSDLASVVAVGGVSYPSDGTLSITENELFFLP